MTLLLTTPLGWVFLLGLLGVLRSALARRPGAGPRRGGRGGGGWPFLLAWLVLMAAACPLVAGALAGWLAGLGTRWPAPPPAWSATEAPQAIVVLAGDLLGDDRSPAATLGPASLQRLQAGLAAARRWPAAVVVVSGGVPDRAPLGAGQRMAEEALRAGLPEARLVLEKESPDTHGNAVFTAPVLRRLGATRVALVTSPEHMARSRGVFAKQGIETLPLPSAPPPLVERAARNLLPDADALARTTSAVHELAGLAVYRVRGWL